MLDGDQRVARAVQDQGRTLDGVEHVPHVEAEHHLLRGEGHPRARREPFEPSVPLPELVVVGQLGREHGQDGGSTPGVRHEVAHRRAQLGCAAERVALVGSRAGGAVDEHETRNPIRLGGGEERRDGAGGARPDEGRPLDTDGIHHGLHVVDPVLGRDRVVQRDRVGESHPPLVQHDHPRERGKARREPRQPRVLPLRFQVVEPLRDEHHVGRTLADHLVGDRQVPAPRVGDVGVCHASTLPTSLGIVKRAVPERARTSARVPVASPVPRTPAACRARETALRRIGFGALRPWRGRRSGPSHSAS